MLAPTALFLVTDRHIENNLPGGHYTFYQDASDLAIGGLAASLAGVWIYGIKGDHPHAKETGQLELETLVNTFLVYAPMQYIAARQRPGEGNGHGDFLRHAAVNTSFPGGHAMFTWAMATVAAQEAIRSPGSRSSNVYGNIYGDYEPRYLALAITGPPDMWVGTAAWDRDRHPCLPCALRSGVDRFVHASPREDAQEESQAGRFAACFVAKRQTVRRVCEPPTG